MIKNIFKTTSVLLLFLCAGLLFTSSKDNRGTAYDYSYTPVFMTRSAMENAVQLQEPKNLQKPGKIYLYKNFILVNEIYKGIHIIDNSNKSNPENIAFIHVDGCIDIAVKGDVIYADNAVDLIAIKFTGNFADIKVTERVKNTFPEFEDPDRMWSYEQINNFRPKDGILVAWEANK